VSALHLAGGETGEHLASRARDRRLGGRARRLPASRGHAEESDGSEDGAREDGRPVAVAQGASYASSAPTRWSARKEASMKRIVIAAIGAGLGVGIGFLMRHFGSG
jgi:hypothetical protein